VLLEALPGAGHGVLDDQQLLWRQRGERDRSAAIDHVDPERGVSSGSRCGRCLEPVPALRREHQARLQLGSQRVGGAARLAQLGFERVRPRQLDSGDVAAFEVPLQRVDVSDPVGAELDARLLR